MPTNTRCVGNNLALRKPASQISTELNAVASLAVDGRRDTQSCTANRVHTVRPWWAVDLGAAYEVGHVVVTSGN